MVVEPGLEPPAVTPDSPKLALIDSKLDRGHPELPTAAIGTVGTGRSQDEHGTATARRGGGAHERTRDRGRLARHDRHELRDRPVVRRHRALDQARRRRSATRAEHELRLDRECFAESAELQRAFGTGLLLVAAAGNEFAEGNPLQFPASLPHVLTVAATDLEGPPSYFSNANAAVDLAAPGERIATAVPALVRPRPRRERLRAARRHELRSADRGRRRRVGRRGTARPDAPTSWRR